MTIPMMAGTDEHLNATVKLEGFIVDISTCYTTDNSTYETCLFWGNSLVVEQYRDDHEARCGHVWWSQTPAGVIRIAQAIHLKSRGEASTIFPLWDRWGGAGRESTEMILQLTPDGGTCKS